MESLDILSRIIEEACKLEDSEPGTEFRMKCLFAKYFRTAIDWHERNSPIHALASMTDEDIAACCKMYRYGSPKSCIQRCVDIAKKMEEE